MLESNIDMGKSWLNKFYNIKKIKWRLRQPKKNSAIIYDLVGADVLLPYLNDFNCIVLHTRQEQYYFRPALTALIKCFILQKRLFTAYEDSFIRIVQPRLIISFIDNNMDFHQIARRHPGIKTVLIQNGIRTKSMDLFGRIIPKIGGKVDHIFTFGSEISAYYAAYLQGDFHPSGSLISNMTPIGRQTKTDSLVFISQYSPDHQRLMRYDGQNISVREFYNSEMVVLPILSRWCQDNDKQLVISGTQDVLHRNAELEFFGAMIPNSEFLLVSKTSRSSSYNLIDQIRLFCFIDSTLGYEALTRGARGVAISVRAADLKDESFKFCWPRDIGNSGPFWTNSTAYSEIEKVLTFALDSDQDTWNQAVAHTMGGVMEFDPDNSVLKEILSDLLNKPNEL